MFDGWLSIHVSVVIFFFLVFFFYFCFFFFSFFFFFFFFLFWLQVATEHFDLFHHSVCNYMFDCDVCPDEVEHPYADQTYVCNLKLVYQN